MDNVDIIKVSTPETGILQIHLNRPKQLNALSHDVLQSLQKIFDQTKQDKSIKAVLLTGEGKGFCAGADIKELQALNGETGKEFAKYGQQVMSKLENLGKPSLAAIHGFAFGGGCELAMSASMRLAVKGTIFGQPEIKLGVIPGFGGTQRLSRLIGKGRAIEICLTGKKFTAEEAYQWGLVNALTDAENLQAESIKLLKEITQFGPVAMKGVLNSINMGYDIPLDEAMKVEASEFGVCCTTKDKDEGVTAFLEKRAAVFSGE